MNEVPIIPRSCFGEERSSHIRETGCDGRNLLPNPTEDLLRGPVSHGCITVLWHVLAQTARFEEVLEINVDYALIGATLIFDLAALPSAIVVPGIQSLTSGWGVVSVTRARISFWIWDTRRQASHMTTLCHGSSYAR